MTTPDHSIVELLVLILCFISFLRPWLLTMADLGDDFDDELLELVGAGEKKRKKRQGSSSKPSATKRRKAE